MNKKKYLPLILVIVIIIVGIYITYITIQPMSYVFMTKWGSNGSMDGQFKNISYITVDFESNVYIADYKNYRIEKFDSSGKFVTKVGSYGSGDGQFKGPFDIAVDTKGYIYNTVFGPLGNIHINDVKRCCIQKFDSSGKFITIWKKDDSIIEIETDASGYIYTATYGKDAIFFQKFTSKGNYLGKVNIHIPTTLHPTLPVCFWDLHDSLDNIVLDSYGYIYITYHIDLMHSDFHNLDYACIYKFDSSGKFITKWEPLANKGINDFYSFIYKLNSGGRFTKRIKRKMPAGSNLLDMAVDSKGNIFLTYHDDPCVYKYTSSGIFLTKFGSKGSGNGQFNQPSKIAIDSKGNIYVVDSVNYCIQKFSPKQ